MKQMQALVRSQRNPLGFSSYERSSKTLSVCNKKKYHRPRAGREGGWVAYAPPQGPEGAATVALAGPKTPFIRTKEREMQRSSRPLMMAGCGDPAPQLLTCTLKPRPWTSMAAMMSRERPVQQWGERK
jgi:hypothetical protein